MPALGAAAAAERSGSARLLRGAGVGSSRVSPVTTRGATAGVDLSVREAVGAGRRGTLFAPRSTFDADDDGDLDADDDGDLESSAAGGCGRCREPRTTFVPNDPASEVPADPADPVVSADANAGTENTAAPTPNATANAPTRPTYRPGPADVRAGASDLLCSMGRTWSTFRALIADPQALGTEDDPLENKTFLRCSSAQFQDLGRSVTGAS